MVSKELHYQNATLIMQYRQSRLALPNDCKAILSKSRNLDPVYSGNSAQG